MKERIVEEEEEDTKEDKDQSEGVQKITNWAKEIKSVSEVGQQVYLYYLERRSLMRGHKRFKLS